MNCFTEPGQYPTAIVTRRRWSRCRLKAGLWLIGGRDVCKKFNPHRRSHRINCARARACVCLCVTIVADQWPMWFEPITGLFVYGIISPLSLSIYIYSVSVNVQTHNVCRFISLKMSDNPTAPTMSGLCRMVLDQHFYHRVMWHLYHCWHL